MSADDAPPIEHVEEVVGVADVADRHAHARLKQRQLQEVAPVERQRIYLLARDDAVYLIVRLVDDRRFAYYVNDLAGRADSQASVARAGVSDLHQDAEKLSRESLSFDLDFVFAWQERAHQIYAITAGAGFSHIAGRLVCDRDVSVLNHSALRVRDDAANGADRVLR